jgi:hypothetical protein
MLVSKEARAQQAGKRRCGRKDRRNLLNHSVITPNDFRLSFDGTCSAKGAARSCTFPVRRLKIEPKSRPNLRRLLKK